MGRKAFEGKTVLITGASAGIGEALARELAGRGARLVLTARRLDRLQTLATELGPHPGVVTAAADVTQDGALEPAVAAGLQAFGTLDVVIANAGFAVVGAIERLSLDDYRRQMETNFFGVLRTIYATLPALRQSRGQLVLIGSVSGHVPAARMSPYGASKFALRALAESAHDELYGQGIGVTLLSPGFVVSDIGRVDNQGQLRDRDMSSAPPRLRMPTALAARQMADAIAARKREAIITGHGKGAVWLYRHFPALVRLLLRRVFRR